MALFTYFELKEFNSATLTGAYQNLGSALTRPCYACNIYNGSDVDVYISTDGSTDDLRVASGESLSLAARAAWDIPRDGVILFKKATQLEIKQVTAAGTGTIVVNLLTEG